LLGRPGLAAVAYYPATTALAVIVGLVVVNVMRPGVGTVEPGALEALSGAQIEHLTRDDAASMETRPF
jgi:Na+/H+-dicarboxylate symporter